MAIDIKERKVVEILDDNGDAINQGAKLIIRTTGGEDILCKFKGLQRGYFVTETCDGQHENKYRTSTIASCKIVESVTFKREGE